MRARFFAFYMAVAALSLCLAAGPAGAQGYDGLFAGDDAPATGNSGNNQPQGYQGLIPGAVPVAPTPAPAPRAVAPTTAMPQTAPAATRAATPTVSPAIAGGSTPVPGAPTVQPIRSSADLVSLARAYSLPDNANKISDEMAARFRLPATSTAMLQEPRPRMNGMLPLENNIKQGIDNTMATLSAKNLRPEDRARRQQMAIESLTSLKRGLTVKNNISDRTYQVMGMPPVYIKEEREALTKSLARIDAALAQLQR